MIRMNECPIKQMSDMDRALRYSPVVVVKLSAVSTPLR